MKRRVLKAHQPCPRCGSRDANTIYHDGEWCFSCSTGNKNQDDERFLLTGGKKTCIIDTQRCDDYTHEVYMTKATLPYSGLTKDTMQFFGSSLRFDKDGKSTAVEYVYPNGATKVRLLDRKEFYSEGDMSLATLFGMDKFSPNSAQAITITEGEKDAMSVYQMLGSKYPCVSVRSASSAAKDCAAEFKYLNGFDKIYLCLDNDEPGINAAKAIASLFDVNKVYFVEMGGGCKDANDYLTQKREEEFRKCWWNAKRYIPKGIVNSNEQIKAILKKDRSGCLATFPFPTLQEITYGIFDAQFILFTALEKVGKTEIIRAIEHHIITTTDYNLGIIHLEEEEKRSVQGLLSYEFHTPVHLPDCNISVDEQITKYEQLVKREGRVNYYTHFGSDDPDVILNIIRYLVTVEKCKFIFLDHITMLVTGFEGEDERKKLDYISTRLAMMTRELQFTLVCVSHVNDQGQTRGSRNISKVADLIVHLDRNTEAETMEERNRTSLMCKGNRFAGRTGPAGYLRFDPSTYQIKEISEEDFVPKEKEPF